jgi:hypothetical protein
MYQPHYYILYSVICALLVVGLSQVLRHAGSVLLDDAFRGNPELARSILHLLDIAYYLVCLGYVAVSFRTFLPLNGAGQVAFVLAIKVGIFLLLLGCMHFFNLLLLAIFRRRTFVAPSPVNS